MSLGCHICYDNSQKTLKKAKKIIERKYNIEHINFQEEENNNSNQLDCKNDLH